MEGFINYPKIFFWITVVFLLWAMFSRFQQESVRNNNPHKKTDGKLDFDQKDIQRKYFFWIVYTRLGLVSASISAFLAICFRTFS